jgi:macrolide transport system ATP-binding/permease protein
MIMVLLSCRNIKKEYGQIEVLKNINLDIRLGIKAGLVGKNGCGKSTLANIIFGSLKPDEGYINFYKSNLRIGYLLQNGMYNINTLNGAIKDDYYSKDFYKTTSNLGLEKVQNWSEQRLKKLSGGEKVKIALANIWSYSPHILILDEPTNHLDFKGTEWLIKELKVYNGSVLVISHDRYFLDKVVDEIIEIEDGTLEFYKGNYSFYRNEKKRKYENKLHQYIEQKKQREKIEKEISNLKGWSSKAHNSARKTAINNGMKFGGKEFYRAKAKKLDKRIKSKIKRLEKMNREGISKPKDEPKVFFSFDNATKSGKRIIEVKNIYKKFNDKVLFKNSSFYIQRGEKIGIIGDNGSGKTTLLKILLGDESVNNGEVWISPSSRIAYLSQDINDLDMDLTVVDALNIKGASIESKARTLLANMGISEETLNKSLKTLSFGERTKIKIADMILRESNLLLLDEPNNHLDLYSREQLEDTLVDYDGTVLIVSHDRYMLDKLCNKLLIFENGKIQKFEGTFSEYLVKKSNKAESNSRKKLNTEEIMVIDNKLAYLSGKLNLLSQEDPEYKKTEEKFISLMRKKDELKRLL